MCCPSCWHWRWWPVIAIRAGRRPRLARMLAVALCGPSLSMAVELSGLAEGVARVALGPALVPAALHLALGIEVRASAVTKRIEEEP